MGRGMIRGKNPSIHSRAAKRQSSPSLNADKALPRVEPDVPAVLAARHNDGISKKNKNKKKSRAQRLRQEKGIERAEDIIGRTASKAQKSIQRGKKVQARKATWDNLNGKPEEKKISSTNGEGDAMHMNEEYEMPAQPTNSAAVAPPTVSESAPAEEKYDFEDIE